MKKKYVFIIAASIAITFVTSCKNKTTENKHSHVEEASTHEDADTRNHEHNGEHEHDTEETHTHSSSEGHNQEGHSENTEHSHSSNESHSHESETDSDQHNHQHEKDSGEHSKQAHEHQTTDEHKHEYIVEKVEPGTFNHVVKTSGEIQALPRKQYELIAPASGIVQFVDNSILPGKEVRRQEVLFRITSKSVTQNNLMVRFEQAKSNYEQAKANYDRARKLFKENIISEKEFLAHKTDYKNKKTDYSSLKQHVTKGSALVKASADGYIKDVMTKEGTFVKMGQSLAWIENNERLLLKAEVSQKYASRINNFTAANFETPDGKLFNTKDLNGKILSRGKATTNESFYLPIYFEIDNTKELASGSFAHVYLIGKTQKEVLTLPKEAFIEEQGNYFVFVQHEGDFEKTPVQIGPDDGQRILVKEGIEAGDNVVTHGASRVNMMQASSSLPTHGHSH